MTPPTSPNRLAIRLSLEEQAALATVASKIASPIRRAPTTSDALRAAVLFAASAMPSATTAPSTAGA